MEEDLFEGQSSLTLIKEKLNKWPEAIREGCVFLLQILSGDRVSALSQNEYIQQKALNVLFYDAIGQVIFHIREHHGECHI